MPISNIVVFLNGVRGTSVLTSFLSRGNKVAAVVAPEKSIFWQGDHQKFAHLNLLKEKDVNNTEFIKSLIALQSDLFLVAGFPTIFKEPILDVPKYGVINLHAGPLPKYKGGSPLNWQIINDEKEIGISIIKMDSKYIV